MLFVCHPNILQKHRLQFLLGVKMAPGETKNNAYAKFWGDKQRALWYVMVFSGVVNSDCFQASFRNCNSSFFNCDIFLKLLDRLSHVWLWASYRLTITRGHRENYIPKRSSLIQVSLCPIRSPKYRGGSQRLHRNCSTQLLIWLFLRLR